MPQPRVLAARPWVLLLVDDEPELLESMQILIETCLLGTRVITANSGRQALQYLASGRIDAIISDFQMPGMDGIELLHQAHERYPSVPRIMLTGFSEADLKERAKAEGFAADFIPKMTPPEELLRRIVRFLKFIPADLEPSP